VLLLLHWLFERAGFAHAALQQQLQAGAFWIGTVLSAT
jgi:hypothetical protein